MVSAWMGDHVELFSYLIEVHNIFEFLACGTQAIVMTANFFKFSKMLLGPIKT